MNVKIAAAAAVTVLAVGLPASATASTAGKHYVHPRVRIAWRHGHATEVVIVTRDPDHVEVRAVGNCASTGIIDVTAPVASAAGERTRTRCPRGWWFSVGYLTGHRHHWRYHRVSGSKNLYG